MKAGDVIASTTSKDRVERRKEIHTTKLWESKRYWRYSQEKMQELIKQGRIIQTRPGAVPQLKRYLDEMPGVPVQDIWTDIPVIKTVPRRAYPILLKSPSPSWSASLPPRPTPATLCSTRSAAAAPPSMPPRSSGGAGSASTSRTSP